MVQQILTRCVKEFENDKGSMSYYEAVQRTFDNHPGNVDEVAVLMKFTILNNLYYTNIWARDRMVNHIHTLATKEDLDALLKSGNLDAVNKIRLGHGIRVGRTRKKDDSDLYSFATKYCHFSNPKCYPIYDKYVEKAIMELQKSNYIQFPKQYDLHVPQEFKNIINQIIQRFSLTDCQQADRALWIYGQYLAGKWPIPGVPKNYAAR